MKKSNAGARAKPQRPRRPAPTTAAKTKPTQTHTPRRRAEHRAMRHEEILRIALELVAERGVAGFTTTELARRNGTALGALYRFFPNKQAVIAALQTQALRGLREDLLAAVVRARALPVSEAARAWASFMALADTWLCERERHPARFRLIDEVLSAPAPVYSDGDARSLEAGVNDLMTIVATCVDVAVASAAVATDVGCARRFPLALWALLHGVSHLQKRDRLVAVDHQSAQVAGSGLTLLLRGLGADHVDVDVAWLALRPTTLVR